MVRWAMAAALLFSPSGARTQTIVDGTGVDIPRDELERSLRITSDLFKDPESTRFRRLKQKFAGTLICGEVNSKNSYGAYAGYVRFQTTNPGKTMILPSASDPLRKIYDVIFESCPK